MCWHVWNVNTSQYRKLLDFLESINEIEDVLIPVSSEKVIDLRSGILHKKEVPIYGNYVFIKYTDEDAVVTRLSKNPLVYQYLGKCSEHELEFIGKRDRNKESIVGTRVEVLRKPFKGIIGKVSSVDKDKVYIVSDMDFGAMEICCTLSEIKFLDGGEFE